MKPFEFAEPTSLRGVPPAIANAIDDAIGVRLTSLPMTPEVIYRALRGKQPASGGLTWTRLHPPASSVSSKP